MRPASKGIATQTPVDIAVEHETSRKVRPASKGIATTGFDPSATLEAGSRKVRPASKGIATNSFPSFASLVHSGRHFRGRWFRSNLRAISPTLPHCLLEPLECLGALANRTDEEWRRHHRHRHFSAGRAPTAPRGRPSRSSPRQTGTGTPESCSAKRPVAVARGQRLPLTKGGLRRGAAVRFPIARPFHGFRGRWFRSNLRAISPTLPHCLLDPLECLRALANRTDEKGQQVVW